MKYLAPLLVTSALLVTTAARAEPPSAPAASQPAPSDARDAEAYCRWVKAAAAAESDPLLFPSIYALGGITSGADATATPDGASTLAPTQRLVLGATYSFGAGGLHRGLALRAQADAECARYATTAALRAFLERAQAGLSERGLASKAKVLDEALPRGAEILAAQRARLAQSRATVEEVDATALRLDALRKLAAETHAQRDTVATLPPLPGEPIRALLARRDIAEEEAERSEGHLRASRGWDLALRGGYDRIFGVRDTTPLFATATLTISLGWLLQGGNNESAAVARREWTRREVLGVDDRIEQALQMLRATRTAERSRLRDAQVLLADLEGRFREISALPGERPRAYADAVWFDLIRTRAEHAYLEEHLRELAALLGEAP